MRTPKYQTDKARVDGLGAARLGGKHWLAERIIALALIPLTAHAVTVFGVLISAEHAKVASCLSHPLVAFPLMLFFLLTAKHLSDGLQVILEDYVHTKPVLLTLLIASRLFCWAVGLAAIFALAKLAFQGG